VTSSTYWRVICSDGKERHAPFDTRIEARHWAWWGHCCTVSHQIKEELPPPKVKDGYYFITPEEGGAEDLEAMWLAEDNMKGEL